MENDKDLINYIKGKLKERYIARVKKLILEKNYIEAKKLLSMFIEVNPENEEAKKLNSELLEKLEHKEPNEINFLRDLTYDFTKTYCPDEKIIFDTAWNILKESKEMVLPSPSAFVSALAMVGKEEEELADLITPVIIVAILGGFKHHGKALEEIDKKAFAKTVAKIAKENGASDDLVEKLKRHIVSFFQK